MLSKCFVILLNVTNIFKYIRTNNNDFLLITTADSLGLTPLEEKELAVTALGGCIYLLKEYKLDHQLLSQGRFKSYVPPDFSVDSESSETNFAYNMVFIIINILMTFFMRRYYVQLSVAV
jgi:hypothetical protein